MLLTKADRAKLPALYSQDNNPDPIAVVKFFSPYSNWTWYATEFDGTDTFFGLVFGHEVEAGYFSLSELENCKRGRLQMVERDRHFKPQPLSQIKQEMAAR